uniref:Uncharacterized protein n=1 Tax=viral metagenome TaxID=1070528 RepID=A0A6M3KBY5_9ZZZZ
MKPRKLDNLPKRKVTVDDLLEVDEVNSVLKDIVDEKYDIDELIVIYSKKRCEGFTYITNGMHHSRIVYMFEAVKQTLFRGDE